MTLAFDITKSAFVPPIHVGAARSTKPSQPLILTCMGEVEHIEDDPALGIWWQHETRNVARCGSVAEAIASVPLARAAGKFASEVGEAPGFVPRLLVILDQDQRLVLAGELCPAEIRWCAPVTSDAEARQIVLEASRVRAQASYETGCDKFSAAKDLRHQATLLEGRLVDPFWRDEVRCVLKEMA